MKVVFCAFALLWTSVYDVLADPFTDSCMKCICQTEGCEDEIGKCNFDVDSDSCGPYQIKQGYYNDCSGGGNDWQGCAKDMACSETCVKSYMALYGAGCADNPTCETYARIHNGGPNGCNMDGTLDYWARVKDCCQQSGGC